MARPWIQRWLGGLLLAAAGVLAYINSFAGVFLFDDQESILTNPTIRAGTGWRDWIHPPGQGLTVSGRPLINVSFALNHRWSGELPWSYHLVNLLIHVAAGLVLFGVARRTLERIDALRSHSVPLGWMIALVWLVHPLQTESVTYVVQRAESLMGLCYLGTLYCFLRLVAAQRSGAAALWGVASVLVCSFGMLCKEVMVSAPLILFLYDRTFVSGSFAAAWRGRRAYWVALAVSWAALALALVLGGNRGGTVGWGSGVQPWQYWLTQGPAIVRYLRLIVWPAPLVLDYGFERHWLTHPWSAVPAELAVAVLAVGAVVSLRRAPRWGFPVFWFFCILAPTSLIPGNRQTLAEHRMYLALAPVLALAVVAGWLAIRRWRWGGRVGGLAAISVAAGLAGATAVRNRDYHSEIGMWRTTIPRVPNNGFGYINLGSALFLRGDLQAAREQFQRAAALDPDSASAQSDWGMTLYAAGKYPEAESHFRWALQLKPSYPAAANNLGAALAGQGRWTEAQAAYRRALELQPSYLEAEANLGAAERELGQWQEGERHLRQALAMDPGRALTHFELGLGLQRAGRAQEAADQFTAALRLQPGYLEALYHRGMARTALGRTEAAAEDFAAAARLRPGDGSVWANLGLAQLALKNVKGAIDSLKTAARLDADSPEVHYDLGLALKAADRSDAAIEEWNVALRLNPDLVEAKNNLATTYAAQGRIAEAEQQLREILQRHPGNPQASRNLVLIYRATGRTEAAEREERRAGQEAAH